MESPPAATTRDGAFLATVLAGALSLGLPDPDYITMHPHLARSSTGSAIDFQFNDRHGREPLACMHAWAERFGVTVKVSDGEASTWHEFDFTHAGVRFHAYAQIAADEEPGPAAVLAESIDAGTPVLVEDDSPFADRHHDPDAAWAAGDDEAYGLDGPPEVCGLPVFGDDDRPCPLFAGHEPMPGCGGDRAPLSIAGGAA